MKLKKGDREAILGMIDAWWTNYFIMYGLLNDEEEHYNPATRLSDYGYTNYVSFPLCIKYKQHGICGSACPIVIKTKQPYSLMVNCNHAPLIFIADDSTQLFLVPDYNLKLILDEIQLLHSILEE